MAKDILRLSSLSKFYTGSQSVVVGLNEINLSFSRGEFVAITGESGSGKSTLSHVLGGILPYESGELFFAGNPTSHYDSADWEAYRRDNISFISQNYGILPGATVMENVVSALLLTGMERQAAIRAAEDLLRQVELWELHKRRAAKLSSGQKQRLSIARALAKPAPILIADEPTGNLDPENTAKVIDLLTQAARDRLVILVTHEFSEAAHCATRHIILQDGKVVMDAPLRPAVEPGAFHRRPKSKKPVSHYVARLQQRSRPVWSSFLVVFFALTAFAVFAFLGTLIVNLDDSFTRPYDNSLFRNGSQDRIIVSRIDGKNMTQEDYTALLALEHVQQLEPYGYVSDSQYAYREGEDFDMILTEQLSGEYSPGDPVTLQRYPRLHSDAPFMQTIPILPDGQQFLTAGRLPQDMYEVVAAGDESMIGQQITVYITNPLYWPRDLYMTLKTTVVGVTDVGSDLYFHEDIGRIWHQIHLYGNASYEANICCFIPNPSVCVGTFRGSNTQLNSLSYAHFQALKTIASRHELVDIPDTRVMDFYNFNFLQDPTTPETISLTADYDSILGYTLINLRNCNAMQLYSRGEDLDFRGTALEHYSSMSLNSLMLYPVGDTAFAEDGTVQTGKYLILDTQKQLALSRVCHCFDATMDAAGTVFKPKHYDTVPVTVDQNGQLTGYTETEVWDIIVIDNKTVIIRQQYQEAYFSLSTSYQHSFLGINEASMETDMNYYWIIEPVYVNNYAFSDSQLFSKPNMVGNYIEVSPADFDRLCQKGSEQVSLTIEDYAYADRIIERAKDLGYAAASPYQLGSLKQDETLAQQRKQTLLICLVALIVVVALQLILLRALFLTQLDSYKLLSNIGLSAKMAKHSILWQVITFSLAGQALNVGALLLCRHFGVERIVQILHYLPLPTVLALISVHLVISLAAAWWIMSSTCKQIYAVTGRQTDIAFDEAEKEAQL